MINPLFAETLIAHMPDAVVYSDRDGAIQYWNGGAARMFGHTAEEAVGRSLDLIIPEGLRARHWDGYRETMRTGRACYWSRSRKAPWRKGDTSGHIQQLVELRVDCDGDTLLVEVEQTGVACHTGRHNCFFRAIRDGELTEIAPIEVDMASIGKD